MSPDVHNDSDHAVPRPDEADGQPKWRSTVHVIWASQVIGMMGFAFATPFLPLYVRELGITGESRVRIWAGLLAFACGIMFRTSYLQVIGSYNPEKKVFEDKDLSKRIDPTKIFHLPIPLYNYVKHGNSITDQHS